MRKRLDFLRGEEFGVAGKLELLDNALRERPAFEHFDLRFKRAISVVIECHLGIFLLRAHHPGRRTADLDGRVRSVARRLQHGQDHADRKKSDDDRRDQQKVGADRREHIAEIEPAARLNPIDARILVQSRIVLRLTAGAVERHGSGQGGTFPARVSRI